MTVNSRRGRGSLVKALLPYTGHVIDSGRRLCDVNIDAAATFSIMFCV
jgi:hypothetical protein